LLGLGAFIFFKQNKEASDTPNGPGQTALPAGTIERRQISVFITDQGRDSSVGEKLATLMHEHGYITSLASPQPGTTDSARKSTEIVADDVNLPQAKLIQSDLGAGMIVKSTTGGFLSSVTIKVGDDLDLKKLPLLQSPIK
jgi:hypothetical protein